MLHSHLSPDPFSVLLCARDRIIHAPIRVTTRKPKSGRRYRCGVHCLCILHDSPKGCWWLYRHEATILWAPPLVHFSSGFDNPIPTPHGPSALWELKAPGCLAIPCWFLYPCPKCLIHILFNSIIFSLSGSWLITVPQGGKKKESQIKLHKQISISEPLVWRKTW